MLRRKLIESSLSITLKSDSVIVREKYSASYSYGIRKVDSTPSPNQGTQTGSLEVLPMESHNSWERSPTTQRFRFLEDLGTSRNIADTREVLAELYSFIGHTTGTNLTESKKAIKL